MKTKTPEERTTVLLIGEVLSPKLLRGCKIHRRWQGFGDSYARCGQGGDIVVVNFDHLVTCDRCKRLRCKRLLERGPS